MSVKKLLNQHLFIGLYLSFSFGLIKFVALLSEKLYRFIEAKIDVQAVCVNLYDWLAIPSMHNRVWDHKIASILFYTLTILCYVIFYGIGFFFCQKKSLYQIKLSQTKQWFGLFWLCVALSFNVIFLLSNHCKSTLFVLWVIGISGLFLFPYWSQISTIKIKSSLYWVAVALLIVQVCWIFSGYMFDQIIANDYLDIPEQTVLNGNKVVDNTTYINSHQIGHLDKYDPRVGKGETPFPQNKMAIKIRPNPLMTLFLQQIDCKYRYAYDKNTQIFSLNGAMSLPEFQELSHIYSRDTNALSHLNKLYFSAKNHQELLSKRIYTPEEQQFIEANKFELIGQTYAGWILFHHSWMLNPINAIALGADPQTQQFIYGAGNTKFLKQIMEYWGGINYQTYFKCLYLFYPLYYILFLAMVFIVFRKIEYVAIGAVLLSTCFFWMGDILIRLAPGHNPNRHCLDLFALLCLYLYFKHQRLAYFLSSLTIGLFSILWSKDFGICLLLAITATLTFYHGIKEHRSLGKVIFVAFLTVLGLCLYGLPIHGDCSNFMISLLGIGVPPTPMKLIALLLILINIAYLGYFATALSVSTSGSLTARSKHLETPLDLAAKLQDGVIGKVLGQLRYFFTSETPGPIYFLSLSLFLYGQLELIYYVWNPSIGHLLSASSTLVLLGLTWIYFLKSFIIKQGYRGESLTQWLFMVALVVLYLPKTWTFYLDRSSYRTNLVHSHIIHHFDSHGSKFRSTMDPQLLQQTSDLINRYESKPCMHLISKYDAILPMLSKKYNAFPSVSIGLNLVSPVDTQKFVHTILQNNPQYIFIDTDINRNFNGDIVDSDDDLLEIHDPSLLRAKMLDNMKNLYFKLLKLYEPVEMGSLITVYRKK